MDDRFADAAIIRNRPGIRDLSLDPGHTDTEVPYLDVVNDVLAGLLGRELGAEALPALRSLTLPLTLPFSREDERRHRYLRQAGTSAAAFYALFAADPDADVLAREVLELSAEEQTLITSALTGPDAVAAAYGLGSAADLAGLADVAAFTRQPIAGRSRDTTSAV